MEETVSGLKPVLLCYQGILISRLPKDGPADLAGVQAAGDRVAEVDVCFVNVEHVLL